MAIQANGINKTLIIEDISLSAVRTEQQAETAIPFVNDTSLQEGNVDKVETAATSSCSSCVKTLTDNEVYNILYEVCTKYGISMEEAKKARLLEEISGKSLCELKALTSAEIKNIIDTYLLPAIKHYVDKGQEVKLNEILDTARDYRIAVELGGWSSVQSYQEANEKSSESLEERIARFYGVDITKLEPEEKTEIVKKYVGWLFLEAKKHKDPVRFIKTDLVKLINNTNDDNIRGFFFDVIKQIKDEKEFAKIAGVNYDSTIADTIIAVIQGYNDKTKATDDCAEYNIPSIAADLNSVEAGKVMEASAKAAKGPSSVKIEEQRAAVSDKFYNENGELFKKIEEKIRQAKEQGIEPDLTEEEQEVVAQHETLKAMARAVRLGYIKNEQQSKEFNKKLLTIANNNDIKHSYYREIQEELAEYVKHNSNELGITEEEFTKLMDEISNGNYSIVVNDESGTTTELNPPVDSSLPKVEPIVEQAVVQQNQSTRTFGLMSDAQISQLQTLEMPKLPEELAYTISYKDAKDDAIVDYIDKNGFKAVKEFEKNYGAKKTVLNLVNNLNEINKGRVLVLNYVKEKFKELPWYDKLDCLRKTGSQFLLDCLTNKEAATKLDGEVLATTAATNKLNERVEDAKEKLPEYLLA